ncbi:MAG: carboxylesterase/lipase family protein [Acidobacteria bacterium]|nr:MAG: carboxylesterase/lipase family protein [Acidobacteriota bacterium]PYR50612.1 MAG: carboxylesterase/lipase family protein [Acidobacteriota bacterium]
MEKDRGHSRRRFLKTSLVFGAAGVTIPSIAPAKPVRPSAKPAGAGSEPIAETAYGKVRGLTSPEGIKMFRGVPYGASTAGKNRFMPPVRPAPWSGVRDATLWGSKAPQVPGGGPEFTMILDRVNGMLGAPGEDCLVVNIWTPALKDGRKRPVMVRIHGGGYTSNTGNNRIYAGHNTARRGDVVYITVNHRLGCLGFLNLADLAGSEYALSGNVGMLDLVAALEWVRDNIENFGGDPQNVLIFGESGGGMKTSTLLGMSAAKGLFHRAGIESGASLRTGSREQATKLAELFLKRLGLDKSRISELHKLPVEMLLEGQQMASSTRLFPKDPPPPGGFGPILDPKMIPQHMFDPSATPLAADIPIIVGTTRDEATLTLGGDDQFYRLDEAGLRARVQRQVGAEADTVVSLYRRLFPSASDGDLLVRIQTDSGFWTSAIALAERQTQQARAPVYMFRFDWKTPSFAGRFGAVHGSEIAFVLDNTRHMPVLTHDLPQAHALAARMNAAWIAFARTGKPRVSELPDWPAYTPTTRATMLFDDMCRVENDPDGEARRYWAQARART